MEPPRRQIPAGRKAIYYLGMGLTVLGVISFVSTFFTFAAHFGDFSNFEENARSEMYRAFGGMAMIFIGAILMGVGRAGPAGSGVLLDPQKAREDLEPWNRMRGGMVNDALSEIDAVTKVTDALGGKAKEVIKVRCPRCGTLNDETARFCSHCGAPLPPAAPLAGQ